MYTKDSKAEYFGQDTKPEETYRLNGRTAFYVNVQAIRKWNHPTFVGVKITMLINRFYPTVDGRNPAPTCTNYFLWNPMKHVGYLQSQRVKPVQVHFFHQHQLGPRRIRPFTSSFVMSSAQLGGSSHLGYVVDNNGDQKSPKDRGCGSPCKWPNKSGWS